MNNKTLKSSSISLNKQGQMTFMINLVHFIRWILIFVSTWEVASKSFIILSKSSIAFIKQCLTIFNSAIFRWSYGVAKFSIFMKYSLSYFAFWMCFLCSYVFNDFRCVKISILQKAQHAFILSPIQSFNQSRRFINKL